MWDVDAPIYQTIVGQGFFNLKDKAKTATLQLIIGLVQSCFVLAKSARFEDASDILTMGGRCSPSQSGQALWSKLQVKLTGGSYD